MGEVFAAVADLFGKRFVSGRSAADDGGDPGVAQVEAVFAVDRAGFAGKVELVEDRVHEVARAVSGKWATGAIGAVCSGGKTEQEDAGAWISEAGYGARPVGLVDVGTTAVLADSSAEGAKARAALAQDDSLLHLLQLNQLGVGLHED